MRPVYTGDAFIIECKEVAKLLVNLSLLWNHLEPDWPEPAMGSAGP